MAAFTAPCAIGDTTTTAVAGTGWQMQGSSKEEGKYENGDIGQSTILEKTHEFFQMCDTENKGFITRRDMQRLNSELPLSAEELENVFDTLDSDRNGYLTLNEFSSGFSTMDDRNPHSTPSEDLYQNHWEETPAREDEDEEEKHFSMLMESLGANSVFEDPAEVHSLWAQLRREEPHLLSNFEDFLARVTSQIKEANQEKREMECALKRKAASHDDEIQHLYEEMEQQIKNEKDRIVLQDYERFLSRSQDLELQLASKEKELEQLFDKQKNLERQCEDLHSEQCVTKVENVKLKQTNDELARELDHTSQELILAQEQLTLLQEQCIVCQHREVYRVTERLQRERASLIKQLNLLREMNKHLRDERDICYQFSRTVSNRKHVSLCTFNAFYFFLNCLSNLLPLVMYEVMLICLCSGDKEESTSSTVRQTVASEPCLSSCPVETRGHLQRIISIEEDHLPHLLQNDCQTQSPLPECSEGDEASDREENIDLVMTPKSPRGQPVGKETSINDEGNPLPPDRLFKIVLVGNSSVGKTSILKRFCDDCFHPGTSATVGIDYSVKTITVDNSQVAMQLWDTAGQERYRSITKQFFRKADGVIVMYDITAEQSFTAVRQWLMSVKEGAGEDIPLMLLGNKTDKEIDRQVQKRVGERLAKDHQMIFYECSARSGHNVVESMVDLARILKEQEDREREKTVQLVSSPSERKRTCC
uniref:Calcium release activated channel regulator 2A n=1 Tax=Echeneis naucrates TaxID=173247 RepID=A0A665TUY6_ECHNA